MKPTLKTSLLFAGIALLALSAGIYSARWLADNRPSKLPDTSQIGVPMVRPGFSLPDLDGKTRSISEWDSKVILLNFWATWCPPCRREMPAFVELKEELANKPFEIIGVAIDRPGPVRDFIDEIGVEYPILVGEINGIRIMQDYGNQLGTLPYTVIIDQKQQIVRVFRREVHKEDILQAIGPLLNLK